MAGRLAFDLGGDLPTLLQVEPRRLKADCRQHRAGTAASPPFFLCHGEDPAAKPAAPQIPPAEKTALPARGPVTCGRAGRRLPSWFRDRGRGRRVHDCPSIPKRHKAIRSRRAIATTMTLRMRRPAPLTRSRNQLTCAEPGSVICVHTRSRRSKYAQYPGAGVRWKRISKRGAQRLQTRAPIPPKGIVVTRPQPHAGRAVPRASHRSCSRRC
jgi:hypothetical protein